MEVEKYYRCAVMLVRMCGVAETLEEREYLPDYDFIQLMEEWAKEYIRSEDCTFLLPRIPKYPTRRTPISHTGY